jgi:hypothetical protein
MAARPLVVIGRRQTYIVPQCGVPWLARIEVASVSHNVVMPMKRLTIPTSLALAFALFVSSAWPAIAEDLASSIVGLWKITSFARKEVATGKLERPYGEHLTGYILYTKGGRLIFYIIGENRKASAAPNPTDAERAELFKSLVAYSGTYKVEGNMIVTRVDSSWVQSWTGTERRTQAELSGNKLTLTSMPFKSTVTGQDVVTTTTAERLE